MLRRSSERSYLTLAVAHTQVLGGADLFLQGFSAPAAELPQWRANDTAVIVVPGNHFPLAVGMMECDASQAKASGMKVRDWREILHSVALDGHHMYRPT